MGHHGHRNISQHVVTVTVHTQTHTLSVILNVNVAGLKSDTKSKVVIYSFLSVRVLRGDTKKTTFLYSCSGFDKDKRFLFTATTNTHALSQSTHSSKYLRKVQVKFFLLNAHSRQRGQK